MVVESERALLDSARAGDRAAVESLLHMYEGQILHYGQRLCGHEEDARDVLQETLLAAYRGLPHFRGEARVSTWLFGIARSFCARQRRRREGEPVAHEELDSPFAQAVASDLTREEARLHARDLGALIQEALSTIAPEHREVLLLRDVEGYSTEEAASELCISVGALKSRLHRARTSLQLNLSRLQVGQCSMP